MQGLPTRRGLAFRCLIATPHLRVGSHIYGEGRVRPLPFGRAATPIIHDCSSEETIGGLALQVAWHVLIVEDDPLARGFFQRSVENALELKLFAAVGTVADALALLRQCGDQAPDVMLVDLNLPDGSGLDVIRGAQQLAPGCESLVVSMFGDEDNVLAAIEAGALGYIHKDAAPHNIAQVIVDMKRGASPISPMIARRVLMHFRQQQGRDLPSSRAAAAEAAPCERPQLSQREQEVLELIARGFSYAEIARIKGISVHTVQTHIKGLYGKLAVHSKNEAVFEAMRIGLL